MYLFGRTLDLFGKILISYTAIAVHYRVRREKRIDRAVFKTMQKEHIMGILGIALIVLGYIFEVISF